MVPPWGGRGGSALQCSHSTDQYPGGFAIKLLLLQPKQELNELSSLVCAVRSAVALAFATLAVNGPLKIDHRFVVRIS